MGILSLIAGSVGILVGIFGKDFYVGDVFATGSYNRKRSTWSGRLISLLAGVSLLALGIVILLRGNQD
jgi:hypothetical protein